MRKMNKHFHSDESGAVTVDWVVLTALIVGLTVALLLTVSNATLDATGRIETLMTDHDF